MVHARLTVLGREDGVALAETDFALLSELVELPANERVVVGVVVGGDERASPVDLDSHLLEIGDGQWREVLEPMVSLGERFDFLVLQTQTLHDLPLILEASGLGGDF